MKEEQAVRIQHELLPDCGCVLKGKPFLMYGIWVLPFTHDSVWLTVYLIDRPIVSEADHQEAKREAEEKLGHAIARPVQR